MTPIVAIVGDALVDVRIDPLRSIRAGGDVPAVIGLEPGGQGANVAVRLARRGRSARLTCAMGDDPAGRLLREWLAADGVELRLMPADRTGVVAVLLDDAGERTMLSQRVPFGPSLDLRAAAEGAEWLVVSGYLLLEPGAERLADAGLPPARCAVLGCALEPERVASWAAAARALAPSLLVLNLDEARLLAGAAASSDAMAVARALAREWSAVVAVTDPDGASASAGEASARATGAEDDAVVDTTGAGDAFAAALLADLGEESWPPGERALGRAMARAVAVASAVARLAGAQARTADEPEATLSP